MARSRYQAFVAVDFDELADEAATVLLRPADAETRLQELMHLLRERVPHYDWAGIYLLADEDTLHLGPYSGPETDLTEIPVGQGICGAAIAQDATIVVPDVSKDDRYLACFGSTRSEIVVPVRLDGDLVGEIDIDSDELAPFTDDDRAFLEDLAEEIAKPVADLRS